MNKSSSHISRKELSEATGLTESEVTIIVRHYSINRDDAGNIHFANFLKHAFMFQKEFCFLPELAEMFAIEERQVNKLEKQGKLEKVSRGIYDRKKTVKQYVLLLRLQAQKKEDTYEEAMLREMRAKADLREIQAAREKRQVVNVEDVFHLLQTVITVTRQRVLNVPKEAIAQLDTIPTPAQREDALKKMLHEALTEISETPKRTKELAHRSEKHDTAPEPEPQQPTPSGVGKVKRKTQTK